MMKSLFNNTSICLWHFTDEEVYFVFQYDDATSDRTVSQLSQSGPFDYMEEVRPPTGV